jgi:hypothetical protein
VVGTVTVEALKARAFHHAPASEANAEIARMRVEEAGTGAKDALSYEVVVSSYENLVESLVPKLVYFLDCRGLRLNSAPGVFLSLFIGDTLYFLKVADFFAVLGLPLDELVRKHGAASKS